MRTVTTLLALAAILLPALPAAANSTLVRGVVVASHEAAGREKRGITIQSELSTPPDAEDVLVRREVPETAVILLDGTKSDFSAFAPGRPVFLCADCALYRVFTQGFRLPSVEGAVDPNNAWWTVALKGAAALPMGEGKPARPTDVVLHLQTKAGVVTAAAALTQGWGGLYANSPAWHDVDATGLKVEGGKLAGRCTVTVRATGSDDVAWAAAVTVALPANAEGLFAVADGAPGKATAQCRPAPAIAADCFAFFRAPGGMPSGSKPLRGEFRLRGGTVADALVGSTKLGEGSKPTSLTATLAEGRLHVEIGLTVRGGAATCAVDASVLGDRFFGTYVTTAGEQTWRGRVAGYLEAVDAPTTNWGESDARKDLAALKAK